MNINDKFELRKLKCRPFDINGLDKKMFGARTCPKTGGVYYNEITDSWGAHSFYAHKDIAYIFTVKGKLHQGQVVIVLAPSDTFTVCLLDNEKRVKGMMESVYIDQIIQVIDRVVGQAGE